MTDQKTIRLGGLEFAKIMYPRIQKTTETALSFNDRFDTLEHCENQMHDLKPQLSYLGEQLEERFECEDQLIEVLHNAHSDQFSQERA